MTTLKRYIALGRKLRASADLLRRLATEHSGASFIFVALTIPVTLGLAGLGFDATIWYLEKRENQLVADNGALAATMEYNRDKTLTATALANVVKMEAKRVNFNDDSVRDITVNVPPKSGPNAGLNGFVEVIVDERRELYLSSMIFNGPVTVQARAVGGINTYGEHCIIALDPTMDKAIEVAGTADVTLNCGIASNSSSDQAIIVDGTGVLNADRAQAYGDIEVSNNGTLNTNTPLQPLSERVADPYYDDIINNNLIPNISASCKASAPDYDLKTDNDGGSGTAGDPYIIQPNWDPVTNTGNLKKFCGGITISGKVHVEFQPGIYVLDAGDLWISGQATVTVGAGTPFGVTFVLTAHQPDQTSDYVGNVVIVAGADVDLMAPTTGLYSGYLVIQDPDAVSAYGDGSSCEPDTGLQCLAMEGGADMTLNGVLYTRTREVRYAGNNAAAGTQCTQIVAKKVTLTGTSSIDNDPAVCTAAGVRVVSQTRIRLVE